MTRGLCGLVFILGACSGGGATDTGAQLADTGEPQGAVVLGGAVEKGPFVVGSRVSVSPTDSTGSPTGEVFLTETESDLGEFHVSLSSTGFVQLEGNGFYFDEVGGDLSAAQLTLRAFYEVSAAGEQHAYINTFTHVTSRRVRSLASGGMTMDAAIAQAETEAVTELAIGPAGFTLGTQGTALNLATGANADNAYLFAVSAILLSTAHLERPNAPDAALQELLNTISVDLGDDGSLDASLRARLEAGELALEVAATQQHVEQRFTELGTAASPPELGTMIDADDDGAMYTVDCDDHDAAIGVDGWSFYLDADGDGAGDPDIAESGCAPSTGYVDNADDCDDADPTLSPADLDGDGISSCDGDCDDDPSECGANCIPGSTAADICDGWDQDCDGSIDEDPDSPWYADLDEDGWTDDTNVQVSCTDPGATWLSVATTNDCDDSDPALNHDDADSDGETTCGGDCDDGDPALSPVDRDGDGVSTCAGDCDDDPAQCGSACVPGSTSADTCDGQDQDCDGTVDEDVDTLWYADLDEDGWTDDTNVQAACADPGAAWLSVATLNDCDDGDPTLNHDDADSDGHTSCEGDCDDGDGSRHPGMAETWYDGVDQDCDGASDYDQDGDGVDSDLYGGLDCHDINADVYPGAVEVWYDGIDGNCDGENDYDQDGDGYELSEHDCDDTDPSIVPMTVAVPGDYGTINDALAGPCSIRIEVASGTYDGPVHMTDRYLELVGVDGSGVTTLSGGTSTSDVVRMTEGRLEGFTITGGDAAGVYAIGGPMVIADVVRPDGAEGIVLEAIDDVTISSYVAGAIAYGWALEGVSVTNVVVDGIDVDGAFGGIDLRGSPLTVRNATVANTTGPYLAGEGIVLWGEALTVENAVVRDCASIGMQAVGNSVTLRNIELANNTFHALELGVNNTARVEDVWVHDHADDEGLTLVKMTNGGFVEVDGLLIEQSGGGEGLSVSTRGGSTLRNVEVRNNAFTSDAIFLLHDVDAENIAAIGNTGTGITLYGTTNGTTVSLRNATSVGNDRGIEMTTYALQQIELRNVISAYNTLEGVSLDTAYPPRILYSNVYGNGTDYAGMTDPTGSNGNLGVPPEFVSFSPALPVMVDLHLHPSSPLIDAGDPAVSDPDATRSDMGVYGGPGADFAYYADSDADGLYNGWEERHGLDPSTDDSGEDGDSDGLPHAEEFDLGTNPAAADTDADGVDDGTEVGAGTDPLDPASL